MKKIAAFTYGIVSYAIFFATFLYAIAWVGDFAVPVTIDSAPTASLGTALLINLGLLTLFAVQHSVMARPAFKRLWTKIVPEVVERSTYVLFSSVALIVMFAFWSPIGGTIWSIDNSIGRILLYSLFAFGWTLVLASTFLINHFELFGLQQVYMYLSGKEKAPQKFVTPGPYKIVRHPLYVGFILAFWATPTMTVAHMVFAVMTAAYIVVAVQFEERDLIAEHGERYKEYRRNVPMLIPGLPKNSAGELADSEI